MADEEPEEPQVGFHRGFSKEVEAITRVFDRGGMLPTEMRANLRKAGMELGSDEVELPEINLPPMTADNPEEAADG